jgi:hypothetical protein
MVDKLLRNLLSIFFLLFVISNIEYAASDMYNVEKKPKLSILIIPVFLFAEKFKMNHFETQHLVFNIVFDDIFNK